MVGIRKIAAISAAFLVSAAFADEAKECGPGIGQCPDDKPCCSQYGACGVGGYCLGGCDPIHSTSFDSCMPAPVCKSGTYTFKDDSRIQSNTKYLGDSSKADWVSQGSPAVSNNNLILTMPKQSVGTVVSSTFYMWYGKMSAKIKTSRGQGVITAFILMSDIKDEIDVEFVGVDLNTAQTNYYAKGIIDYHNSGNISVKDTFNTYHTYEVDWTPDSITWSVDGKVGRTKKRSDTYNSTSKGYDFPQTPSRVQLSLWPGGLASNGKGTIDWAGGPILWNGPEFEDGGPQYYYSMVEEVTVECYKPPSGVKSSGSKSYKYISSSADQSSVEISDDDTILASFKATGKDPQAGKSTDADKPQSSDNVETVPGLTGAGFGTNDRNRGDSGDSTDSAAKSDTTGFSQGGSSGSSSEAGTVQGERVVRGSMLAVFIAIVALGIL